MARTGIRMRAGSVALDGGRTLARDMSSPLKPVLARGPRGAVGRPSYRAASYFKRNKRLYFIKDSGHPYLILAS